MRAPRRDGRHKDGLIFSWICRQLTVVLFVGNVLDVPFRVGLVESVTAPPESTNDITFVPGGDTTADVPEALTTAAGPILDGTELPPGTGLPDGTELPPGTEAEPGLQTTVGVENITLRLFVMEYTDRTFKG